MKLIFRNPSIFPEDTLYRFKKKGYTSKNADEEAIKNWIKEKPKITMRFMIVDKYSITGFEADTVIEFGGNDCVSRAKLCYIQSSM